MTPDSLPSTTDSRAEPEPQPSADSATQEGQSVYHSRAALRHGLADIEAAIQQAEASGRLIGQSAEVMRQRVQHRLEALAHQGTLTDEDADEYRRLLLQRRSCDLVQGRVTHSREGT